MVEGARLESVFRGNSNVGSNPTLSAIPFVPSGLLQIDITEIVVLKAEEPDSVVDFVHAEIRRLSCISGKSMRQRASAIDAAQLIGP